MIYLFYVTVFIGLLSFFVKKRRFDFFSIAFLSSLIYFLPGFFGYVGFVEFGMYEDIAPMTYIVFISVILSLVLASSLYDIKKERKIKFSRFDKNSRYLGESALILSLFSLVMLYLTMGNSLFNSNKSELLQDLNRWIILFHFFTPLATIIFFIKKKYNVVLFCFILLVFDIYIGFRSSFALTLISIITIFLNSKGAIRLIRYWKTMFVILFATLLLLVVKVLLASFKYGNYDVTLRYLSDFNLLNIAILHSEPFGTQLILNSVIVNNFETSVTQFTSLFVLFIPLISEFGMVAQSFNSQFQQSLFSGVTYGMGSNIWAQMWSVGWVTFLIFLMIFNYVIYIGSRLLLINSNYFKSGIALFFSYWSFYIHRNDIAYQLTLERRVIMIYFFAFLISSILYNVLPKKAKLKKNNISYESYSN